MTTSTQVRPGMLPPVVQARLALWSFLVVNVVIIEFLFVTSGEGKNGILTVAKFFGLHAALLLICQLLLVARVPWLDRRIGMDRLTVWHRWIGFTMFWTVLTHATIVVLGYAALDNASAGKTFLALAGVPASLLGMFAAAIVLLIAAISTRYVRRKLRYEVWHGLHMLLYVTLSLAFVHQLLETTTFRASTFATIYWWALWLLAFGCLVTGRIVMPVWRNTYHRFRVEAVVPEAADVVSVHITGRHLDKLPARAGQFSIWRFPGHRHWWLANPFSLSAAPNSRSLRLTAKAVGSGSAGLRNLKIGNRVLMEGPYGSFTTRHRRCDGILLIAGGVGITPIRALLEEEQTGNAVVLYRVRDESSAVLLREVRELVERHRGRLYLLTGRTGQGARPFEPEALRHMVPDITERDVYVCGPPAMTAVVENALRKLGVPRNQVHAEKFGLA
ncbi:ferric reductase-like transmembrane domain-containing protein [Amycolatopsis sp. EV170708-02-1]|uniref:ferredoxin reductase family protein n=1 Tax=Amycolatopsis sp. EV170708-02-1 TaxID=2919322 RepID=UPI001F0BF9CF|nr:ferredoxin reductase family protein [Amycolatopsis sp. EV170708-02-1]UMP06943.1 ferredoxin reductase family protein [Amycolatopsis sp. EV170708-02-1]